MSGIGFLLFEQLKGILKCTDQLTVRINFYPHIVFMGPETSVADP